jgi:hypothetical protein
MVNKERRPARLHFSHQVNALSLAPEFMGELVNMAKESRAYVAESFRYVPVKTLAQTGNTDFVVMLFDKECKLGDTVYLPGDFTIRLRSEWNEQENPLGK